MSHVAITRIAADQAQTTVAAHAGDDGSFHAVLSALNPLQYLPVVGTIYRAATGDQIDEGVRRFGSAIVSGLLGGPVGIAINVVMMAAEKLSGVDLERTGQDMLTGHAPPDAGHVQMAHSAYARAARQAG